MLRSQVSQVSIQFIIESYAAVLYYLHLVCMKPCTRVCLNIIILFKNINRFNNYGDRKRLGMQEDKIYIYKELPKIGMISS